MNRKGSLVLSVIVICFSALGSAQNWSGILDPTRAIDWSLAGIPGGIPNRTTVCSTIQASTYGNGTSDATAGIQAALNACPANQVVSLSAGTFRINTRLNIPSGVVLRGAGASQTILSAFGSSSQGTGVVNLGSGSPSSSSSASITGGATAGSNSITLSTASGISVGSYLLITELNDSTYVTSTGNEGNCSWCDQFWSGTRARGQIVEVTSVTGTTVGVSPSLYSDYSLTPLATYFTASAKYAGVENLQVYANNTGYGANFAMNRCAYCWIKGVEGNYADGDHVEVYFSYRDEVRDSYFSNAYTHAPGTYDSALVVASKSSAVLVENNILERLHVSLMMEWGAAGNVFSYNYSFGNFDASATNVLMPDLNFHGAHPQFNLMEGNVLASIYPDSIWGSSSHGTMFRNWATGMTRICNPLSGRGTIDCTGGHWAVQANRAIYVAGLSGGLGSLYYNIVGNVAGSAALSAQMSEYAGGGDAYAAAVVSPGSRSYSGTGYDYSFGYGGAGDSSGYCSSRASCAPYSTAFLHGNYSNANGSIGWDFHGTGSHTLPASFYKSSKPSWWGSLPWPAIGPDVTGGTGPGGHASLTASNPAQACYNSTAKDASGLLVFNASSCYDSAGGGGSAPPPPTNLTAIVR